jgi:hypothetical protein
MAISSPSVRSSITDAMAEVKKPAVQVAGLTPEESNSYKKRINNAPDDATILRIRRELEKKGIDTSVIPGLQPGSTSGN